MSEPVLTRLSNGCRLVYKHYAGAKNYSFGVGFPIGSFHDPEGKLGLAHYHEHMAIKDTRRQTAEEIRKEIKDIGGGINAWTSYQATLYLIKGRDDQTLIGCDAFKRGLDILEDCLENALLTDERLTLEKTAIEGEYGQSFSPRYEITRKGYQLAYPTIKNFDDARGHIVLGSAESLKRITREDIIEHEKYYTRNNAVLLYYGGKTLEDVKKELEDRFKKMTARPPVTIEKIEPVFPDHSFEALRREAPEAENVTVYLNFKGYGPSEIPNYTVRYAAALLQTKMLENLRGKHGLIYSCDVENNSSSCAFRIGFGTEAGRMNEALRRLKETLEDIKNNPPSDREIKWAMLESQYNFEEEALGESKITSLQDDFETLMRTGKIISLKEIKKKISKISKEGVMEVYQRIFKKPPIVMFYGKGVDKVMPYDEMMKVLGYGNNTIKAHIIKKGRSPSD